MKSKRTGKKKTREAPKERTVGSYLAELGEYISPDEAISGKTAKTAGAQRPAEIDPVAITESFIVYKGS